MEARDAARVLAVDGIRHFNNGYTTESVSFFLQAIEYARNSGSNLRLAYLLSYAALGTMHSGDIPQARVLRDEAENHARTIAGAESFELQFSQMAGGWIEWFAGRPFEARRYLDTCLSQSSFILVRSPAHAILGNIDWAEKSLASAEVHWVAGAKESIATGYRPGIGFNFQGLFRMAAHARDWELAAALIGYLRLASPKHRPAALSKEFPFGAPQHRYDGPHRLVLYGPSERDFLDQFDRVENMLGEANANEIRKSIFYTSVDDSSKIYLTESNHLAIRGRPQAVSNVRPNSYLGLTPRELEVLGMLVSRLTNAEIAAALFVDVRTAEKHVANILSKLGVASRRDAASLAVGEHLIPVPPVTDRAERERPS